MRKHSSTGPGSVDSPPVQYHTQIIQLRTSRLYLDLIDLTHRENTRREESKYLECENRQVGLSAIAKYIFKPPTEKFKIGR